MFATIAHGQSESEEMMYYYQHPNPDKVLGYAKVCAAHGQEAMPLFAGFFSQAMAQNPGRIKEWITAFDNDPKAQENLLVAAWFSNTKEARQYFQEKGLTNYLASEAPNVLEADVDNAELLDILWGNFFATGDMKPIKRITEALKLYKYSGALDKYKQSKGTEQDKQEAYYEATCKAAIWSLSANSRTHPKVLQYCKEIGKDLTISKAERDLLATIITGAESASKPENFIWRDETGKRTENEHMKAKDGFGAQLVLTDDENIYAEWAKPETPHFRTAVSVSKGKQIIPCIIFCGAKQDQNGDINVECQLTITKPDGSVAQSIPNVVCAKGKAYGPPNNLLLSETEIRWSADPEDPTGTWKFDALVKDNNSNTELQLTTNVDIK